MPIRYGRQDVLRTLVAGVAVGAVTGSDTTVRISPEKLYELAENHYL